MSILTMSQDSVREAVSSAFGKLDPRHQWRNPVMFLVWVGATLTTVLAVVEPFLGGPAASGGTKVPSVFTAIIAIVLWATVWFANFAEAIAEGRGKAQADTLRKTRTTTTAHRVATKDAESLPTDAEAIAALTTEDLPSADLTVGDVVVVPAGELIPGDGDIIWGVASIDESAITGESAPVVRESLSLIHI